MTRKAPPLTLQAIPGRQEARQAAQTGVRRGLAVGVASALFLGLLIARTFRTPGLQGGSAQTASAQNPAPVAVPRPQPEALSTVPSPPASEPYAVERPNPYASAVPAPAATPLPVLAPPSAPAVIIAAPPAGTRPPAPVEAAPGGADSKPASYTDADLARVRSETPPPTRSPAQEEDREGRLRQRREAVRAAQQAVAEAQAAVDDLRREAREDDDDGLQEELADALSTLKSAQRDLARARRSLQELEDQARPVLPPQ